MDSVHSIVTKCQTEANHLDGVQVSGFRSFQKSVVHVRVSHRDVLYRSTTCSDVD